MALEPLQSRSANMPAEDGQQNKLSSRFSRLSLPFLSRLRLSFGVSFLTGFGLGSVHGGKMAGLRFRAENAHRLPDTTAGWYLYHKSKNYQATYGGVKEGVRMGLKVGSLVAAYVVAEEALDTCREEKDFFSSVIAGMGTAGVYGAWSRLLWTVDVQGYMIC